LLLKPTEADTLERTLESALVEQDRRVEERALAFEDPLLFIGTRRAFEIAAQRVHGQAVRHDRELSVVMVDVDRFKDYNDKYGHVAGDGVLRSIAHAMHATLRSSDELFRYGGEEFVLILPDTDAKGVRAAMERHRAAVYAQGIQHVSTPTGRVTISLGAAVSSPQDRVPFAELLDRADQALYWSKHHGRNRAIVWDSVALSGLNWSL
jgi:diguanylate cyclase (GGDEF)-like protein